MKNISQGAHFYMSIELSTRNMFNEVEIIKSLGALCSLSGWLAGCWLATWLAGWLPSWPAAWLELGGWLAAWLAGDGWPTAGCLACD